MDQDQDRLSKKQRIGQSKTIGTHNGTFHCDEALAVFLLRHTARYADADVVRTRDPKRLEDCDIVVDVGGVYDESKQRFDHHQREFSDVFGHGFSTKLSSAGLVYKHFGKEVIANNLGIGLQEAKVTTLWLKLYSEFMESIDAIDNGVSQYSAEVKPRYKIRTDLSSRVGWLNPAWNESVDSAKVDTLFAKASELTGQEFLDRLNYYANAWLPARDIVLRALNKRKDVEENGRIILFQQFVPWKEHLFEIEPELSIGAEDQPFYVVYPDETGGNWRIQAVPISSDSFVSRKALPEEWRGLRDNALSEKSGIPGCIFVHASGFIGGNSSEDGALAMARAGLRL